MPNENPDDKYSIQTFDESERDLNTPYFTHPEVLTKFMPKPSGNMVKIRCPAAGKHLV